MRAKTTVSLMVRGLTVMVILVWAGPANSYNQWSVDDDATYCGQCHGDFRDDHYMSPVDGQDWGNLHDLHRITMLNGDCNTCHLSGGRFPVLLDESVGGNGFDPISCTGCHDGPGLRLHHTNAGVPADNGGTGDTCVDCHGTETMVQGENVLPPYYFTPDAVHLHKPTDPCNPSPGFPENFAGLTIALDNDGDLAYDALDSDCGLVGEEIFSDGLESGDTLAWDVVEP